jgi:hypothetical protein
LTSPYSGQGFFDAGEFCLLLVVSDGHATLLPGLPPLSDSGVIDMAAEHQGTPKRPLLFRGGLEFVLVGFVDTLLFHVRLLCLIGTKAATIHAFPVLLNYPASP